MIMTNIVSNITRPSDIARNLGLSRQAIHNTINQMVKMDIVRLTPDPDDRRHMILSLTEAGARMRHDAQQAMDALTSQIAEKLGAEQLSALMQMLEADWGDNMENHSPADPSPAYQKAAARL